MKPGIGGIALADLGERPGVGLTGRAVGSGFSGASGGSVEGWEDGGAAATGLRPAQPLTVKTQATTNRLNVGTASIGVQTKKSRAKNFFTVAELTILRRAGADWESSGRTLWIPASL